MEKEINKIKDLINGNIKEMFITSSSMEDTKKLGKIFASLSTKNTCIALNGELGSGKTVFMSGFAEYFGIEDEISSPTFTIVNEYSNNIFHFDVYRIKDESEFINSIGDEYFDRGICVIEWADIIKNILPRRTIFIDITKDEILENIRNVHIWRK
ncbi:putative uncharacterized protein [Clostridium sp. CAG:1219]|nr:putative uncharacterized protein [Clostridium sp. CAG:1219]